MSSVVGDWLFETRDYRVLYIESGPIRLCCIFEKADDAIPIGSASTLSHGAEMARHDIIKAALSRAQEWIIRDTIRKAAMR